MTDHGRKMFYSMGEVSEMLDVNHSLVRFWEKKFSILKPHKNKKGNRMFTPADVDNLKLIYHLVKEKGMTLDGAAKALKKGAVERTDNEMMERLLKIRSLLEEIRQELGPQDGIVIPASLPESAAPHTVNGRASAVKRSEAAPQPAPALAQEPVPSPQPPMPFPVPEPEPVGEPGLFPDPVQEPEPQPAPKPRIVEQTLF